MNRQLVDRNSYFELLASAAEGKKHLKKLALDIGWSQTTISKMVTALENKGYVKRLFGGRYRYVQLTEEGRGILEMVKE